MKKLLSMLTVVGLLSTSATTGLVNTNQTSLSPLSENYATVYDWENVGINHSVESNAWGIDTREDTAINSTTVINSWETSFKESKVLVVSGYFALHPYEAGIYLDNVLLYLNPEESTDLVKVWEFEQTNQQNSGLISQTSQIKLTVTAQYNESESATTLIAQSYIYAKTSMQFHSCSTTSQIENIAFLSN